MVLRMGDHTLFVSGTAKSPIDFKAAGRLTEQIKQVLGDDLEKVLDGRGVKDLRNRLFNIERLANPEADRLKRQLRDLFYFNEAWIPELKKSELGRVHQLYDLSKDLGQQNNIVKDNPELVALMKKKAEVIYASVMADAPEWLTPEEQAAAKKGRANEPQRPATGVPDDDTAKLLARIDKKDLPDGYHGSRHQASPMALWPVLNPISVPVSANSGKKNAGSIRTCPTREPPSSGFSPMSLQRIKRVNRPTW